jgi:Zn-dependent protease with chaperone function
MALKADLKEFPELSHHAFQHPLDSQAIASLQKVPGLPKVVKFISEHSIEKYVLVEKMSSALRVNAQQYPSIYKSYVKMAQVLDVKKLPQLYIDTTNEINAYAMGIENYTIVLCSGLIDIMTEDELLAILGHELGHVKCEHQLYKTMTYLLTNFGHAIISNAIPLVGQVLSLGIQLALLEWNRKAEFSCDRAALLATQDVDAVAGALAKLAGFSKKFENELSVEEVEVQAEGYKELGEDSMIIKAIKVYSLLQQTHPYPVVRVKEIKAWEKSDQYQDILRGRYGKGDLLAPVGQRVLASAPRVRICPNPKCHYPCPENHNFCTNCQTNIRNSFFACGQCRAQVEANWVVCSQCGNQLQRPSEN